MIDKVPGNRIGADINPSAVDALVAIRDHIDQIPQNNKEFTEDDYSSRAKDFPLIRGFASFAYSYGGKMWGGWRRGGCRDYVAESYRNALKQCPNIQGVEFVSSNYEDLEIPSSSLVYCDPPYEGTTSYKKGFDHGKFWEWCRNVSDNGHSVFVSEYSAPDDFECVWSGEIVSSLTKNTGAKRGTERLFRVR